MFVIEGKWGKTRHWGIALDEGYGVDPHVEVTISLSKHRLRRPSKGLYSYKLNLRDEFECRAIPALFRHVAAQIEDCRKRYLAREKRTEGMKMESTNS